MIKYDLICKCGKTFESWFSSSSEFDLLRRKKHVKCIYCESSSVKKTVMSPNLTSKSNKEIKKPGQIEQIVNICRKQGPAFNIYR